MVIDMKYLHINDDSSFLEIFSIIHIPHHDNFAGL